MHSFYTDDKDISIVASADLFRKSWALSQGSFNVHFSKSRVPVCNCLSNGAFWQRFQVHLWGLLKGVPCLCPIGVLADISKQTPATAQLCNQPDQLSEGRNWEPYPIKKNPSRVFSIFLARSSCCMIAIAKAREGCEHTGKNGTVTFTTWSQLNLTGSSPSFRCTGPHPLLISQQS